MDKAGLEFSVMLYMRPKTKKMWQALESQEKFIQIEGSPGTGKSALVWAWVSWKATKKGTEFYGCTSGATLIAMW